MELICGMLLIMLIVGVGKILIKLHICFPTVFICIMIKFRYLLKVVWPNIVFYIQPNLSLILTTDL